MIDAAFENQSANKAEIDEIMLSSNQITNMAEKATDNKITDINAQGCVNGKPDDSTNATGKSEPGTSRKGLPPSSDDDRNVSSRVANDCYEVVK